MTKRIFIKVKHDAIPMIKDRFPFIYLEKGRLEVDDSSVKFINSDGEVYKLPIAIVSTILLSIGTTVTHAAVKACAEMNCTLCWVGDDGLLFYSGAISPTSNTKNFMKQLELHANKTKRTQVARNMFKFRFPNEDVEGKTISQLFGMEGHRVRKIYIEKANKYNVGWNGRIYTPDNFKLGDLTNKLITATNAALYALLCSWVHTLGYSPYIGFVHNSSPLPFIYDLADLYKEEISIDLSFSLTAKLSGGYDRNIVLNEFRERVVDCRLFERVADDISKIFEVT